MDQQSLFDGDRSLTRSRRYGTCCESLQATVCKIHFILRCINLLFSIIVTASVADKAWPGNQCLYNSGSGVCNYVTTVGVLACCVLIIYLIVDLVFDAIEGVLLRKLIVIADLFFCGVWSFVWFTGFCYLSDAWRKTKDDQAVSKASSSMQAAIVFSFFNIITFALLALISLRRFRDGAAEDFSVDFTAVTRLIRTPHPAPPPSSTYSSLPVGLPHQSTHYSQSEASSQPGHAPSQLSTNGRSDLSSEATPLPVDRQAGLARGGGVKAENYGSGQGELVDVSSDAASGSNLYGN